MGRTSKRKPPLPITTEVVEPKEYVGGIEVSKQVLSQLNDLGISSGGYGAVDLGNGIVILSTTHVLSAMAKLTEKMQDTADSEESVVIGRALGYLSNANAKMLGEFRAVNDMRRPGGADKRRSFQPGTVVTVEEKK